ncbi:MAG: rhomboid family intramembrane serine protease [Verrucomicrobia bacterium]|nr:rhomboid family intramembrane serine protease [Verrucomicrobiota bacterium]
MAAYDSRSSYDNPAFPPVILNIMIGCIGLFVLRMFFIPPGTRDVLIQWLALWPAGFNFYPWQVLTYGLLHGGMMHLFFNMLALWMFGRELELNWGSKRFLMYFLFCVIGAGLIQLIVATLHFTNGGRPYPTIGASGGTFGILLAFGMMFPRRQVMLLFPPIPMEARYFVMIFGGLELFLGVSNLQTGIAHFAHLGGMLFGFLLIQYWRGKLPIKPKHRFYF